MTKAVTEGGSIGSPNEAVDMMALVESITIPDHWLEIDRTSNKQNQVPIDRSYLQALGLELASTEPMTQDRWEECLNAMYRKVNRRGHPEANLLWVLFLRKGIYSLGKLIERTTVDAIILAADQDWVKQSFDKRGYPKDKTKRGEIWWNEDMAGRWYRILLRMFDPHAELVDEKGTANNALIIELTELLVRDAIIPFVRKQIELGIANREDLSKPIEAAVQVIETNKKFTNQEELEARVRQSVRATLDSVYNTPQPE